jgi:hypothetical protein
MSSEQQRIWDVWAKLLTPAARRAQDGYAMQEAKPLTRPLWHIIVFDEINEPTISSFEAVSEAMAFTATLAKSVHATILFGSMGGHGESTASSDMRYFFHPDGSKLKLYAEDAPIIEHADGYLGESAPDATPALTEVIGRMRTTVSNSPQQAYGDDPTPDDDLGFDVDGFDGELPPADEPDDDPGF